MNVNLSQDRRSMLSPLYMNSTSERRGNAFIRSLGVSLALLVLMTMNQPALAHPLYNQQMAIAQYTSNGSLDTSFHLDGKLFTNFDGEVEEARAVAVQDNGRIVVAGQVVTNNEGQFALARYTSNGSLDTSFHLDGKLATAFDGGHAVAEAIAIQDNGRIVVAGWARTNSGQHFALARYTSNGELDPTFDSDGKLFTTFESGYAAATDIAIQDNDRIVVAGWSGEQFALARYNPNGSLDTTFNGDGKLATDLDGEDAVAEAVAIQDNGRIVVAGWARTNSGLHFALARYASNGELDPTFDIDGKLFTDFDTLNEGAHAMAIRPTGEIVATGFAGEAFPVP